MGEKCHNWRLVWWNGGPGEKYLLLDRIWAGFRQDLGKIWARLGKQWAVFGGNFLGQLFWGRLWERPLGAAFGGSLWVQPFWGGLFGAAFSLWRQPLRAAFGGSLTLIIFFAAFTDMRLKKHFRLFLAEHCNFVLCNLPTKMTWYCYFGILGPVKVLHLNFYFIPFWNYDSRQISSIGLEVSKWKISEAWECLT